MSDKPKLTIHQAVKEFPAECKAALNVDCDFKEDEYGNMYFEDEEFSLDFPSRESLTLAAGQWLAGRDAIMGVYPCCPWPHDLLRRLLEEIGLQIKQDFIKPIELGDVLALTRVNGRYQIVAAIGREIREVVLHLNYDCLAYDAKVRIFHFTEDSPVWTVQVLAAVGWRLVTDPAEIKLARELVTLHQQEGGK